MIFVDSREPRKLIDKLIKEAGKENVRISKLNYGDYIVARDDDSGMKYVIERKTIRDLKGSIQSGRIWKQLKGMMMYDDKFRKILLIEGMPYLEIKRKNLEWNRWIAWKCSFVESYGIILYESAKIDETVYFLKKMNERVNRDVKKDISDKIKFEMPTNAERDYLIGESEEGEVFNVIIGIKGIGVKNAMKLLREFGNLRNIFCAKEEELKKILGKKKGEKVWRIANKVVKLENFK